MPPMPKRRRRLSRALDDMPGLFDNVDIDMTEAENRAAVAAPKAPTKKMPIFDFEVPTELPGVDPKILDPRDTYTNVEDWNVKAKDLAARFIKNFNKYENNAAGKALVAAGPQL